MEHTSKVRFLLFTTCLLVAFVPSRLSGLKLITIGVYLVTTNEIMTEDWEISGDGGVLIESGVKLATDGYNIDIGDSSVGVEFDVQGQLDVNSGLGGDSIITNTGVFNSTGTVKIYALSQFHNQDNATVNVSGGTFEVEGRFDNGADVGSAANFNVTNGTLKISTDTGEFRNAFKGPGNLTISGGTFVLEGGTLINTWNALQGNLSISNCNITIDGGEISKVGTDLLSNITIYGTCFNIPADDTTPLISDGHLTLTAGSTFSVPTDKTFTLGSNGSLSTHRQITNNGVLTIDGALSIESDGYLNNKYIINNNNLLVRYPGGLFAGGFTNNGTFIDYDLESNEIEPGQTPFIPSGFELRTPDGNNIYVNGQLTNKSPNSWDIYGTAYTYSIVENGDAGNAGTINISFPGKLYVLGGTLTNSHADSVINVNSGGSLYNYYGIVDLETGGADSLDVKAGGKFYNARGNNPGTFTLNNGCLFLDATEVHLDRDLDVDYTWTITEPAVIRGYGNEIRFGTTYGAIVIDGTKASLLLDDVIISGISGNKIRATDANSTLSIGNVVWVQDNNTSYTWGNIFVNGEWVIAGDDTIFEYATEQTSTIGSNGGITCLRTIFEYNASNANGVNMVDDSAVIHLDQGALLATQALTLENGTLITTGSSSFIGTAQLNLQNVTGIHSDSATITVGNVII